MKILAFYTRSHTRLAEEHFLPSASRYFGEGNVDCRLVEGSPEGDYGTPGFTTYCQARVRRYAEACEEPGGPLVLSDVDVRFHGDVPRDLEEYSRRHWHDAYFQWDGKASHCMGFVLVRSRPAFARLLRQIAGAIRSDASLDDQRALKRLVLAGEVEASLGVLPPWKYWTHGLHGCTWRPGAHLSPPRTVLMHHGNWVYGVEDKLEVLSAAARFLGSRG